MWSMTPNGRKDCVLRCLQRAAGPTGFVTDDLLVAVTGAPNWNTLRSYIGRLRGIGYNIIRVRPEGGAPGGYRMSPERLGPAGMSDLLAQPPLSVAEVAILGVSPAVAALKALTL